MWRHAQRLYRFHSNRYSFSELQSTPDEKKDDEKNNALIWY